MEINFSTISPPLFIIFFTPEGKRGEGRRCVVIINEIKQKDNLFEI